MVLFVLNPVSEGSGSGRGGGLGSLGFAGSTKITQPSKNLAFIPSRAFSASSKVAYLTKPNPLDLPESLSVITLAAKIQYGTSSSYEHTFFKGRHKRMN